MKLELDEIFSVIDKVKNTGLACFDYQDTDIKLHIKGAHAQASQKETEIVGCAQKSLPQETTTDSNRESQEKKAGGIYIESPMVGTFYAAPAEDKEAFVSVGDVVKKGQTVGIVEAMKLMNEIEAECDGIVEEILVKNEQLVEFGQPLLRLREV